MPRYDEKSNPYSWMPGFLRRFLNLTYDEPAGGAGSSYSQGGYSQGYSQGGYTSPAPTAGPSWSTGAPPRPAITTPTRPAPTEGYRPAMPAPAAPPPVDRPAMSSSPNLGAGLPPVEGYVQPVLYLLRAYARGALPPQGLETFTKEVRATTTDVWKLYSHWIRFQAEEGFRMGRELLDAVADDTPAPPPAPARRIKVTVANGNGGAHADPPAAPVVPPPPPAAVAPDVAAPDAAVGPADPADDVKGV